VKDRFTEPIRSCGELLRPSLCGIPYSAALVLAICSFRCPSSVQKRTGSDRKLWMRTHEEQVFCPSRVLKILEFVSPGGSIITFLKFMSNLDTSED
jgi:hypothetical protein